MTDLFYIVIMCTCMVPFILFSKDCPKVTKVVLAFCVAGMWWGVWYLAMEPITPLQIKFPAPTYYISSHHGHLQLEGIL